MNQATLGKQFIVSIGEAWFGFYTYILFYMFRCVRRMI